LVTLAIDSLIGVTQKFTVAANTIELGDGADQMALPCGRIIDEQWDITTKALSSSEFTALYAAIDALAGREFDWRFRPIDELQTFTSKNFATRQSGTRTWQISLTLNKTGHQAIDECFVRTGDLESSYPILPIGLFIKSATQKWDIKTLGDRVAGGVDATAKFGYNAARDTWTYSAVIPESKKIEVHDFLAARSGNYFEFRLVPTSPGFPYSCATWQFSYVGDRVWEFSASFRRNFTPFKEANIKQVVSLFDYYDKEADMRAAMALSFADIDLMLDGSYDWLMRYKRDTFPLILNNNFILKNSFHRVLGRGGYFPGSAGTTEGQAIAVRAAMLAFQATGLTKWKTLAINLGNALLSYYYPVQIPLNWQPSDGIQVPHWVINVDQPFVSKGKSAPDPINYGYFDLVVNFTNGEGFIPSGNPHFGELVANVYRVYPTNDRLLFQNVYAKPLGGFSYAIDYWVSNVSLEGVIARQYADSESPGGRQPTPTNEAPGKIKLSTNYTGQAKIVYSAYTGATIAAGALFEPYPMWRELRAGEALGAIDVFPWSEDGYDYLYQATNDTKWLSARESTRYTELIAATVINPSDWYRKEDSPNPFAYAGSQIILTPDNGGTHSGAIVASRVIGGNKDQWLQANIPSSTDLYPSAEYQNYAVRIKAVEAMTVKVEVACSVATEIEVVLSLSQNPFNFTQYYTARLPVSGGGVPASRIYNLNEFLLFDTTRTAWHPHIADSPIYTYSGGGGSATATRVESTIAGIPRFVWRIQQSRGSGFAGAGFVAIGKTPRFPLQIFYQHSGSANLKIEVEGKDYRRSLPASAWEIGRFEASEFTDFQGKPPSPSATITKIEIEATGACDTYAWWIGVPPQLLQPPVQTYKALIVSKVKAAHTLWIGDFLAIGSPSEQLTYSPGVPPFTANVESNGAGGQVIAAWRGIPMSGYVYPDYLVKTGQWARLEQAIDFLLEAQVQYRQQSANGTNGLFMPAFAWGYWDAGEYANDIDEWTFNAIDPNSQWVGYQVRPMYAIARAWLKMVNGEYPGAAPANLGSLILKAEKCTMQSLSWASSFYTRRRSFQPATDFRAIVDPEVNYNEPHAASFIGRAALCANLAGGNTAITLRLIKASIDFLRSQYVTTGTMQGSFTAGQPTFMSGGQEYRENFGFWVAEEKEFLALLKINKGLIKYPKCVYFIS
jgi:phage-related protein